MKLEVGMFVRTEYGIIEKVNNIYDRHTTDNIVVWLNAYGDGKSVFIDDFEEFKFQSINTRGFIKKEPSFNLIDLIEVGDYVNGCFVDEILNADECYDDRTHFHLLKFNSYFTNKDIKSIVTKEQFSSMIYKVVE